MHTYQTTDRLNDTSNGRVCYVRMSSLSKVKPVSSATLCLDNLLPFILTVQPRVHTKPSFAQQGGVELDGCCFNPAARTRSMPCALHRAESGAAFTLQPKTLFINKLKLLLRPFFALQNNDTKW